MSNYRLLIFGILFSHLFYSHQVLSSEVLHSHASHKDGVFQASIEMKINAPVDKVYTLLTDFDYLSRLNDNISNSDLIESDPPEYIVLVETHICVLFVCMNLQQTQKVIELGEGYIAVEDIQGQSDFVYANSRWHIFAKGESTHVTFSSEMKPDFWLPPFFGAWLFKKRLIEETQIMIERLEQLATHDQ